MCETMTAGSAALVARNESVKAPIAKTKATSDDRLMAPMLTRENSTSSEFFKRQLEPLSAGTM